LVNCYIKIDLIPFALGLILGRSGWIRRWVADDHGDDSIVTGTVIVRVCGYMVAEIVQSIGCVYPKERK